MKLYARNKRARYDYEILDTVESGIMLEGQEVKSIRSGGAMIAGGFVYFEKAEPWLYAVNIRKWQTSNDKTYDPFRKRKLLLNAKEILKISEKVKQKGINMIPLSIYPKGQHIKVELALVRGKKSQKKDADKIRREEKIKQKRDVKEFKNRV
jgi:SsrA-binding protein